MCEKKWKKRRRVVEKMIVKGGGGELSEDGEKVWIKKEKIG